MKINWHEKTSLAYLTLVQLNIQSFPIAPKDIKFEGVIISSYQKYSRRTNTSIDKINGAGSLDDAYVVRNLPNMDSDISLILYDNTKDNARAKHSLLHEVGHIKCNHIKHGDNEEVEAHFFASQMNAPNILIKAISERGYKIDKESLMSYFGLSGKSATKKSEYLNKYYFNHVNEFDDIILQQFSDFLNNNFPPITENFFDSYYDELEEDRSKWY